MGRDTKGEGCGIWPFLLEGGYFDDACRWHDAAYLDGSFHQRNMGRAEVDLWFYKQMREIAGRNVIRRLQAAVYFSLAKLFGGRYWEGKR